MAKTKPIFVRFVVGTNREKPTHQTGVITSLEYLKKTGQLPDYEAEHVEEIFLWLNTHLPCPPFKAKDWSPDAISWFKGSAQSMISKFREMIAILEQYDHPVRMLKTEQPGMILYEDEFQVVAQSRHY
jgi:hypothetical protein